MLKRAEKLAFGWRSAFSAAIRPFLSVRALAPEATSGEFFNKLFSRWELRGAVKSFSNTECRK
jgi:hypothetical protein